MHAQALIGEIVACHRISKSVGDRHVSHILTSGKHVNPISLIFRLVLDDQY